jgi:hypothetical protein
MMDKSSANYLDEPAVQREHEKMKRRLARLGYSIMHRRKGQFWLVHDRPMTLAEIDQFIKAPPKH